MIEVAHLTKCFGPITAVRDLSFRVRAGEVVGILGPNGAGKTTTMRVLTCYLPATSGEVKVGGFDAVEHSLEVRRRIGYLPENAPLYGDMTVRDYLRFMARVRRLAARLIERRIQEMTAVCGLQAVLGRVIGELSKGYRQRVGLAQALIHEPQILILDEPTSGLDPNQIAEIRQLIKTLGRERTVILCTHILPEVSMTCDRILILSNGGLVAQGTTEELSRQAAGDAVYHLTLRPPQGLPAEGDGRHAALGEVRAKLEAMPGIRRPECLETIDGGRARFRVSADAARDLGEELFRLAVENGWTLSELRREAVSLEEVFSRLTTREK
ncbi:MAG: ATP-binding cassette domain-containing protein [Candidatus Tectomicrobia bacterium]|nr:ATP-binding cassette domain-containing protein [Candidatus Tectomicrobia bacterium]